MINRMTSFLPLCTQCWEPRRGLALGGCSEDGAEFWSAAEFRKGGLFVQPFREAARVFRFRLGTAERVNRADRKSTRLNSSHSQISYAVFCLKKKKNQKNADMYC